MAAKDLFQSPDYFNLDELLTDEQKLIRETVRDYVKKAGGILLIQSLQI